MILIMPKFDFNHIDPVTGMPRIKKNETDKINLMSIRPSKSGWIKLFQNRVLINSVGNLRYSTVVWYDKQTGSLCEGPDDIENGIEFRLYRLPAGMYPAGWIYCDEHGKYFY